MALSDSGTSPSLLGVMRICSSSEALEVVFGIGGASVKLSNIVAMRWNNCFSSSTRSSHLPIAGDARNFCRDMSELLSKAPNIRCLGNNSSGGQQEHNSFAPFHRNSLYALIRSSKKS